MHEFLCDIMVCPMCKDPLSWEVTRRGSGRVIDGSARCSRCDVTFPVEDEVGVFLTPELQRDEDQWERLFGNTSAMASDVVEQLLSPPMVEMCAADLAVRSNIHSLRRQHREATEARELMISKAYTPESNAAMASQIGFVVERLKAAPAGPILDIATGQGRLLTAIAGAVDKPVIASDISPFIMRYDRERLIQSGLYNTVSCLAFDARFQPFHSESIPLITSFAGLSGIRDAGTLLQELRRVCGGEMLSVMEFYPEDDIANGQVIAGWGLGSLMYRESALRVFEAADWSAVVMNAITARAAPIPKGEIVPGATIDGIPVAQTQVEACTITALAHAPQSL